MSSTSQNIPVQKESKVGRRGLTPLALAPPGPSPGRPLSRGCLQARGSSELGCAGRGGPANTPLANTPPPPAVHRPGSRQDELAGVAHQL